MRYALSVFSYPITEMNFNKIEQKYLNSPSTLGGHHQINKICLLKHKRVRDDQIFSTFQAATGVCRITG